MQLTGIMNNTLIPDDFSRYLLGYTLYSVFFYFQGMLTTFKLDVTCYQNLNGSLVFWSLELSVHDFYTKRTEFSFSALTFCTCTCTTNSALAQKHWWHLVSALHTHCIISRHPAVPAGSIDYGGVQYLLCHPLSSLNFP